MRKTLFTLFLLLGAGNGWATIELKDASLGGDSFQQGQAIILNITLRAATNKKNQILHARTLNEFLSIHSSTPRTNDIFILKGSLMPGITNFVLTDAPTAVPEQFTIQVVLQEYVGLLPLGPGDVIIESKETSFKEATHLTFNIVPQKASSLTAYYNDIWSTISQGKDYNKRLLDEQILACTTHPDAIPYQIQLFNDASLMRRDLSSFYRLVQALVLANDSRAIASITAYFNSPDKTSADKAFVGYAIRQINPGMLSVQARSTLQPYQKIISESGPY